MKIETIKAADAPGRKEKPGTFADEFLPALNSLGRGEVLRIMTEAGKSVRGMRIAVGRISNRAGVEVEAWSHEDTVYVKRI